MQPGSFSRPVVVREWPSRHCFISLPRPWASLTLPAPTPTFRLEVSEERSVLLSWAGDLHNPNPGDENTILVGREVLRCSGILDGAFGIITQVQVPPPCSSVTVHVGSLTEWQDLALNAEVAQSAFLNQVRVLGLGQSLPLWLEGGVRITLTVARIDPPHDSGILQPMTQVEVLPPTEQEESEGFRPINFTPTAMESFEKDKSDDESLSMGKTVKYTENTSNCDALDVRNQTNLDQNSFEMLMKYLTFRLQQQRITSESTTKKDFSYGYRVVPIPQAEDSPLCDLLTNHPSLVVVSKQSLVYVEHQNKTSFVARIKKIYSPKEKAEKLVAVREEDKAAETKQQGVSVANSANKKSGDKFCTVIVWENFVESKEANTKFIDEMKSIIKGNTCVISDCLRRLMKLEILSIVELNSRDINVKSLPVTIDVSPLMPVTNSGIVCDTLKRMLKDFVDETHVVINAVTLLNMKVDDKNLDVFVTVRDGVPLKLSKESVVLLEVTHVSNPSDLPHISSSIVDLRSKFTPRFQYVGSEEVVLALQRHILLGSGSLLQQYKGVPQFALLHGSKGLGKTSLVETIAENLSSFPYFLHFQIISFKHLKGKKMETVEKKLQSIFREAIFRRPSVIVLEDLDSLVPSKRIEDQESGPLHDHTMQMVNMLKGLLDDLLEFCHADDDLFPSDNPKRGGVMVVATAVLRTSVHPLLVNPQGCHYFPCSFGIPPLESEGRVKALNAMISVYLKNSKFHQGVRSAECCVGSSQREDSDGVSLRKCNRIETNLAMKLTENFVLPDLSHLALRTFLQARHRWEGNDKQCRCIKCGSVIENRSQSTSSSLLSLAVSENNNDLRNDLSVVDGDLEAARQGYIPLALRGLELSEKKTNGTMKVGGLAEACKTLKETLTWPSTYPSLFSKVKLRLRSGVLLYGPPGCGKTLIANSVAENCQLNFISVKGPELLSKYIGASEQAVRDAFERASSAKPCVLFFDEFESIAPRRGHDNTGVTDRVVNQLLTQMDGVEGLTGVYVLAATSRPDLIDPALLRPGRLDKCVFCPMPSLADREDILRILSEGIDLGEEIDWGEIASTTENHSGADLQSLLSTAQILVAQEALGETLYEGVIPPDRKQDRDVAAVLPSCEEKLSCDDFEEPHDEANSLVQVALEKEKVKFTQRRFSSQEDTSVIVTQEDSTNAEDTEDTISHSSSLNQSSECHSQSHGEEHAEKRSFKVFKRHIEASLREVKPSVTAAERQKYERLYSSFSKSRDGNFGKHSPGKRATLA